MGHIRAETIRKDFGEVQALKGVSLEVSEGELFFLLGGSGCGKTTLLRCLAGLETPTSGKVLFDEKDVTALPTHKREAAMVFQSYALWPHMTVGQNVAFGLEERKVPKLEVKKRVAEVLKMVQLEGFAERGIDQMSGGQQQRVSLARALVVKPKCLLLDEPLSNLDARLRIEMRTEIRRIVKENNLTGVYVTHDQEEALSMADRMAVMELGEVKQVGTPEEIYRTPNCSYVAAFIGETNLLSGEISQIVNVAEKEVVVDAKLGPVTGKIRLADWVPEVGEEAVVSIRPEALRVCDEGGQLRGVIEETVYLGDVIQYRIRTKSGELLQATEMNPHQVRQPGEGEVGIDFAPEDVVVLRD